MVSNHLTLGVLAVLALLAVSIADEIISKREIEDSDMNGEPKRKRPFCNAFTGCGRKRSDDSMASLPDLQGSEPAVAELSRQILSEAKMWEAIQEARAELQQRRRQHQVSCIIRKRRRQHQSHNPQAMLDRELQITSYRKRRDIGTSHQTQGPRRR